MIVVNYNEQLREAFNAGKAAGAAPFIRAKLGKAAGTHWNFPETYEAWLESINHRPAIARG